eukprot:gene53647-32931_t
MTRRWLVTDSHGRLWELDGRGGHVRDSEWGTGLCVGVSGAPPHTVAGAAVDGSWVGRLVSPGTHCWWERAPQYPECKQSSAWCRTVRTADTFACVTNWCVFRNASTN